jgi:Cu/Ag efflux protein CusF
VKLKRSVIIFVIALAGIIPAAGCRRFARRQERANATVRQGVGTVESIAADRKSVQINHEAMQDYMPAMSMTFRVKRPSVLDSINQGDKVDFTIRDNGSGYVLTEIKKH